LVLDWVLIATFLGGMAATLVWRARCGPWAPLLTIVLSVLIGIRALYLLEARVPGMAALQGGLFLFGLLAIRINMQGARAPGKESQ